MKTTKMQILGRFEGWVADFSMHVSLAERLNIQLIPRAGNFWRFLMGRRDYSIAVGHIILN